jgi:thiosulfate reductase cytochrome b subunit
MTKFFLGGGRTLHFLAAWVLVVNGVISFLAGLFSGRLRRVILHLRKTPGMYSGVQRLAYATLILLVVPLMVLSGLTMSPSVIADYPSLAVLFSGRHSARTVHFILAVSITLFTIGHILLALRSPARLLGMATGRPIVGEIS